MVIKLVMLSLTYTLGSTCEPSEYGDILRGAALSAQKNKSDLKSDCFLNADKAVINFEGFIKSISDVHLYLYAASEDEIPEELLVSNPFFKPLNWAETFSIVLSDTMVACDVKSLIKQLSFRTSTMSGIQDVGFVIFQASFGYLAKYDSFF